MSRPLNPPFRCWITTKLWIPCPFRILSPPGPETTLGYFLRKCFPLASSQPPAMVLPSVFHLWIRASLTLTTWIVETKHSSQVAVPLQQSLSLPNPPFVLKHQLWRLPLVMMIRMMIKRLRLVGRLHLFIIGRTSCFPVWGSTHQVFHSAHSFDDFFRAILDVIWEGWENSLLLPAIDLQTKASRLWSNSSSASSEQTLW